MPDPGEISDPQPHPTESADGRPQTLGDLRTGIHLGLATWLVIVGVLVAAAAFFILVALLGVDNS
ncbi:MAG: hypothetical protein ACREOD_09275 [Candidatus Dormibacteria bacterium]